MTTQRDFRRHGARMVVVLTVLTVYQRPAPQSTAMLLPTAQARTEAPAIPAAVAGSVPATASAPEAPPAIPLADPFAATSWAQPAPPAGPSAPVSARTAEEPGTAAKPPPPAAPPLPFVYVGRYAESGRQVVMLMRGEQLLLLQQGDTVDNTYRVERISTDRIELTYLPLGTRQSVRMLDSA